MQSGSIYTPNAKRLPAWLRRSVGKGESTRKVKSLLREKGLKTVCEEARCPNLDECFTKGTATFLLLGGLCTRACTFCSVEGGKPLPPDQEEPQRVAASAELMGLEYVVLTSVTRDDLPDGGAGHFASTVRAVKNKLPEAGIEVLTPDFGGVMKNVDVVCEAEPHIYNHNIETVQELYESVRPGADYAGSLKLIEHVSKSYPGILTKSGFMLGLGENEAEVLSLMKDLHNSGCHMLTIGQYMQPGRRHHPVVEYVEPEVFDGLAAKAKEMGFRSVYAGPLVRSSFNAEIFRKEVELGRGFLQD